MHAHMGLRVEEWEDGQVKIGIGVFPKDSPTVVPSSISEGQDTPQPLPPIPKSAFVIRPPENYESQGGINITYAHNVNGESDLIIMLNPQDQGQQDKISFIQQKIQEQYLSSNLAQTEAKIKKLEERDKMEKKKAEEEEEGEEEVKTHSSTAKDDAAEEEEGAKTKLSESKGSRNSEESEKENEGSNNISRESSGNHSSPQEALNNTAEQEIEEEGKRKEGLSEEKGTEEELFPPKKSGTIMKRVSWVEDCEKFREESNNSSSPRSRNNSKENKRESVRKSIVAGNNGSSGGGGSNGTTNRTSPMKKRQNGSNSPPDDAASLEGYTVTAAGGGKRNSGDKSRIPVIATNGDYQPSCDYYRRKMLRECLCNNNCPPNNMADNWYGYSSLQRYAGQKVVKKIAEEQKRLEEDISSRRKTEIWILGNDMDDFLVTSPALPLRKKTTRLKPIQIVQ